MVTKQKPPEPGALERQQRRQARAGRNKKYGAFAMAAAIGVVAVVLVLANRPGGDTTTPADTQPSVNPADAEAVDVATGFLDSYGAFDVERALTYVADDADLADLGSGPTDRPRLALTRMLSYLEAQGYEQIVDSCLASTFTLDTFVTCPMDFHLIRSSEIGRGPFTGGSYEFTVRDGEIVRASVDWDYEDDLSPQMWEPFAAWVARTHPADVKVMYLDESQDMYALTDESIRLWEQNSKQYVEEVQRGNAE